MYQREKDGFIRNLMRAWFRCDKAKANEYAQDVMGREVSVTHISLFIWLLDCCPHDDMGFGVLRITKVPSMPFVGEAIGKQSATATKHLRGLKEMKWVNPVMVEGQFRYSHIDLYPMRRLESFGAPRKRLEEEGVLVKKSAHRRSIYLSSCLLFLDDEAIEEMSFGAATARKRSG